MAGYSKQTNSKIALQNILQPFLSFIHKILSVEYTKGNLGFLLLVLIR